jgi:hypothetical protein
LLRLGSSSVSLVRRNSTALDNRDRLDSMTTPSVPADRYFGAAVAVLKTLRKRVAANALELARHGVPKQPLYLTGQVGGQPVSIHAEGSGDRDRSAGRSAGSRPGGAAAEE